MEAKALEQEKDSDDGGFLKRSGSKERRLENMHQNTDTINQDNETIKNDNFGKDEQKPTETLQGTPRKKLEGEIGNVFTENFIYSFLNDCS